MKNIEVTYDALICENGTYEQGEAAFILPMTDELAAEYLAGRDPGRKEPKMRIATLEKIHELLKGEVEARRNAEDILKKAHRKRQDDLEAIAAAVDDMKDESLAAAKRAADEAKAVHDDAIRELFAAVAALRDFEKQEF